jgi:hypothetical protein
MRTKLLPGLLLLGLITGCSRQEPATSQPPAGTDAAAPPAAAPASTDAAGQPVAPAGAPPAASALTPAESAAAPSATRGTPASTVPAAAATPPAPPPPPAPRFREVTLPSGTELPLSLQTALASDTSTVEDPVRATVRRAIAVDGDTVIPAGTPVRGVVTGAERSAKVKGRATLSFRFTSLTLDDEAHDIRTSSVAYQAEGTKKKDAAKIGIGAGAGAIVGGIIGGGKGAAIGTAVGGGAGTGMVLATRGEEVRLAAGTPVTVRLSQPLTVQIPLN